MDTQLQDTSNFVAVMEHGQLGSQVLDILLNSTHTKIPFSMWKKEQTSTLSLSCKTWRKLVWSWRDQVLRLCFLHAAGCIQKESSRLLAKVILLWGQRPRVLILRCPRFQDLPLLELRRKQLLDRSQYHRTWGFLRRHIRQHHPFFGVQTCVLLPISSWGRGYEALQSKEALLGMQRQENSWRQNIFQIENILEDDTNVEPFFMSVASWKKGRKWCKCTVTYNWQTRSFEKGVPPDVDGIVPLQSLPPEDRWKFRNPIKCADRYIPTRMVNEDKCRNFLQELLGDAFDDNFEFPIGAFTPSSFHPSAMLCHYGSGNVGFKRRRITRKTNDKATLHPQVNNIES